MCDDGSMCRTDDERETTNTSFVHRGDDYKNHTKCISEDEKYGGKDFQAKVKKGDVKQQQWTQVSGAERL